MLPCAAAGSPKMLHACPCPALTEARLPTPSPSPLVPRPYSNQDAASKRTMFDWLAFALPCLSWLKTYDLKKNLAVGWGGGGF